MPDLDLSNLSDAQLLEAIKSLKSGALPANAPASVAAQGRAAAAASPVPAIPGADVSKLSDAEIKQRLGLTAPATELRGSGESGTDVLKGYGTEVAKGVPILGGLLDTQGYLPDTKQFEAQHPIGSTVAQVGGGSMGLGLAGGAERAVLGTQAIPRILGMVGPLPERIGFGAVGGAGLSAADAATRGESPTGAGGAGLVFGGAAPVIGRAGATKIGGLIDALSGKVTTPPEIAGESPLVKQWLMDLARRDLSSPQLTAERQKALGPQGFLWEMGPNLTAAQENIIHNPGAGQVMGRHAIEGRSSGTLARTEDYLDQAFGPNVNVPKWIENMKEARRAGSSGPYATWNATLVPMTPELHELAQNPYVQEALPQAAKFAKADGKEVLDASGNPTAGTWDYIKQALWDKEQAAGQGTNEARMIGNARHGITDAIDTHFANHPDPNLRGVWQQARQSYAAPSEILDAFEQGQQALARGNVDQFFADYQKLSPPARQAFNQGFRANISDAMGDSTTAGSAQRSTIMSPSGQAKIKIMLGASPQNPNTPAADELLRNIQAERIFKGDERIAGGSPTAPREFVNKMMTEHPEGGGLLGKYLEGLDLAKPQTWLGFAEPVLAAERAAGIEGGRESLAHIMNLQGPQRDQMIQALMKGAAPRPSERIDPYLRNVATYLMSGPGSQAARTELQK